MGLRFDNPSSKKCLSHCPNCGSDDIDWCIGEFDEAPNQAGTCNVCGCEFKEYYTYSETEWDIGSVPRVPCTGPLSRFYTYMDEVQYGDRVATKEDCEKCHDKCDVPHCLINDVQETKGMIWKKAN